MYTVASSHPRWDNSLLPDFRGVVTPFQWAGPTTSHSVDMQPILATDYKSKVFASTNKEIDVACKVHTGFKLGETMIIAPPPPKKKNKKRKIRLLLTRFAKINGGQDIKTAMTAKAYHMTLYEFRDGGM